MSTAIDYGPATIDDVREFKRSILGSRSFTKSYDLLDGSSKVMFATFSLHDHNRFVKYQAELEKIPMDERHEWELSMFYVGWYKADAVELRRCQDFTSARAVYTSMFGEMPVELFEMYVKRQREFVTLVDFLRANAFSAPFWQTAGPAS